MSSDSDEPLSVLKEKIPPHARNTSPPATSSISKKKLRKLKKKVIRPPSDGINYRYYASKSPLHRQNDVWLYLKDFNPVGPYSCLLCSEWFISKNKIVVHYILNHKKDYCYICRYFVENRSEWNRHGQMHIPISCSQCPAQFPHDMKLREHFAEIHELTQCRLCGFTVAQQAYTDHLSKRHAVTNIANKNEPVLWQTEYDGSPTFSCALCLEPGIASLQFFNHYMGTHRFTLKCFTALMSGFDVPFTVYGATISNSFLENELKKHSKVGYIDRDKFSPQISLPIKCEPNLGSQQPLSIEIKHENVSDTEQVESMEIPVSAVDEEPEKKDPDPILNYKGLDDFDITLVELIIINNCQIDYLRAVMNSNASNTVSIEPQINCETVDKIKEVVCPVCTNSQLVDDLETHMVKIHLVITLPSFVCRFCMGMYQTEAELNSHMSEEINDFKDLWICQFCDLEFDGRQRARSHLNEHWSEMKSDNCFSPHLGFRCRYCPTLFWTELDREKHHNGVHFKRHKEDFYRCGECLDVFSDKMWLMYHYSGHHPDLLSLQYMMRCTICCLVFTSVDQTREHFTSEHPEARKLYCSLGTCCFKPFRNNKSFKAHLQTLHGRDARPPASVSCAVCGREFSTARACASHAALSHGPGRYRCQICPEVLQSNDERKLHLLLQHPDLKPYSCTVCGRGFRNKSAMYVHRSEHHTSGDYNCNYCGKHFTKRESFREHMLIHEGPRHTCAYCPMTFTQRSNMQRHERRHTGERPYTCDHCGRSFSDLGACRSHMRIHISHEAYGCPYCGQTFSQKSKLRYHIRKHTGEGLETCNICSKLFTSVFSLKEHMIVHEKGRYRCPKCDKEFQCKRYMTRHLTMYHNAEPQPTVACPLCEFTAPNNNTLRRHVLTHATVKFVKCRLCPSAYSTRRTAIKHIMKKHNIKGSTESIKQLMSELPPKQCGLNLDNETIDSIFETKRNKYDSADVVIGEYVTIKELPIKPNEDPVNESEEREKMSEDEESESKARVKRKKMGKKKKSKKVKKEREESEIDNETEPTDFVTVKREESEIDNEMEPTDFVTVKREESKIDNETEPTDFVTVKLEITSDYEDVE